jgi:hypothetical protein
MAENDRMRRLCECLALACVMSACGAHEPPITSLAGEIHLHQYADGAHLSALFIDPPTPLAQTSFDSALPALPPGVYDQGDCTAYSLEACAGPSGCPSPPVLNGGPIAVDGLPMPIDFTYDPAMQIYTEYTILGPFLPGGIDAQIVASGQGVIPAFGGTVQLPQPFNPSSTIEAGLESGLQASWTPSNDGTQVKILLSVVPMTGYSVVATCTVDDSLGTYRVPDDLLALMPPAPRTLQLELSRYRLINMPLGDGRGVVVHGGFSVLSGRAE